MTLVAILAGIAVPSFSRFRSNAELSDFVSSFIAAANSARTTAMKQGKNVVIRRNGNSWTSGWFVYIDHNWNVNFDAAGDEIVFHREQTYSGLTISRATGTLDNGYLVFSGAGTAGLGAVGGTLVVTNGERSSSVKYLASGRIRSCRTGSVDC